MSGTVEKTTRTARPIPDPISRRWLDGLQSDGHRRAACTEALHALLLKAARYETQRRRSLLQGSGAAELEDIAYQAASDALVAVMAHLETFRGKSLFTTWAYKFVFHQVSTKMTRHVWRDRRQVFDDNGWDRLPERLSASPAAQAEQRAQFEVLRQAVDADLTALQRHVFVAIGLNEVPVDVVAARLNSTRGAVHKALHDARTKLRASLEAAGLPLTEDYGQ